MPCVVHHIVLNALQSPLLFFLDFLLFFVNSFHLLLVEIFDFFEEVLNFLFITYQIILCFCNLLCYASNRHFNILFSLI